MRRTHITIRDCMMLHVGTGTVVFQTLLTMFFSHCNLENMI